MKKESQVIDLEIRTIMLRTDIEALEKKFNNTIESIIIKKLRGEIKEKIPIVEAIYEEDNKILEKSKKMEETEWKVPEEKDLQEPFLERVIDQYRKECKDKGITPQKISKQTSVIIYDPYPSKNSKSFKISLMKFSVEPVVQYRYHPETDTLTRLKKLSK